MKRIATFTTVWKRPAVTSIMMNALRSFQDHVQQRFNHEVYPFFVLSPDDPNKDHFLSIIKENKWAFTFAPNSPLGDKAQKGLDDLKMRPFDYLMHIDTDDIISPQIMNLYEPMIRRGHDWFGSRDKHIFDCITKQMYYFEGYPNTRMSVNGGRMISRRALASCNWQQWTKGIEFGLNYHQKIYLEKKGHVERFVNTKNRPCVLELKTMENIHPIEWFKKEMQSRLHLIDISSEMHFDEYTMRLLRNSLEYLN